MNSVLRSVKKRKKVRRLGDVNIISREEYADFDLDAKVEAIRALVPLGLLHVNELLDQEVTALAGERYARKAASTGGRRTAAARPGPAPARPRSSLRGWPGGPPPASARPPPTPTAQRPPGRSPRRPRARQRRPGGRCPCPAPAARRGRARYERAPRCRRPRRRNRGGSARKRPRWS